MASNIITILTYTRRYSRCTLLFYQRGICLPIDIKLLTKIHILDEKCDVDDDEYILLTEENIFDKIIVRFRSPPEFG